MEGEKVCSAGRSCRLKSSQVFIVAGSLLVTLSITLLCIGFTVRYEVETDVSNAGSISYWRADVPQEQDFWYRKGIEELKIALTTARSGRVERVRKVILFVGHGADAEILASIRFRNSENLQNVIDLSWDRFPHVGRLKNICGTSVPCDPFTEGTVLFGGVHPSSGMGGSDVHSEVLNCSQITGRSSRVESIVEQAQRIGLRTGFVTTRRVTGPTVAALYARPADASWECDAAMPPELAATGCRDSASQLLLGTVGERLHVIMGGGRQAFGPEVVATSLDPIDESACRSREERNLLSVWQERRAARRQTFQLLQSAEDLHNLNGSAVDYVFGVFANGDLRPCLNVDLKDMVLKALDVLGGRKSSYLLVAETHIMAQSDGTEAAEGLLRLNEAVEATLGDSSITKDDTLVLIVFTGSDVCRNIKDDHRSESWRHTFPSDTLIYASGPKAYLFRGLNEETFVAHAVAYVLGMGPFQRNPTPSRTD